MCSRNSNYKVVNTITGHMFDASCNSYACPECGPRKARKLAKYMGEYLKSWDTIRFWTFTMTSKFSESFDEHYKVLSRVWQDFVTYLRRSKSITKKQKNFKYIKVYEIHKSGFIHIHVFIDKYLPRSVVQNIWESLCQKGLKSDEHCGFTFVKGLRVAAFVANYVAKYVTKLSQELSAKVRRWSCSHGIKIMPCRTGNSEYVVVRLNQYMHNDLSRQGVFEYSLLEIQLHKSTLDKDELISQTEADFPGVRERKSMQLALDLIMRDYSEQNAIVD